MRISKSASYALAVYAAIATLVGCNGGARFGPTQGSPYENQTATTLDRGRFAASAGGLPQTGCPPPSYRIAAEGYSFETGQKMLSTAEEFVYLDERGHCVLQPPTPERAKWSSTGGRIVVTRGGKKAFFSARSPGQYTITATFLGHSPTVHVTVQVNNEHLLCSNCGGVPLSGLAAGNGGVFYGTTVNGGTDERGTVFRLTPNGKRYDETVLYNFRGGNGDGASPSAGVVIDTNGALYGTTSGGGKQACAGGCGTVFQLTPEGSGYSERVLYRFQSGADGATPVAALLERNRALYGTTRLGGTGSCPGPATGCGTVFALTPNGSRYDEKVLYSFQGGGDGFNPMAGLVVDKNGAFYGTTAGYINCGDSYTTCGTVFRLAPKASGYQETVIHSFPPYSTDGDTPVAALLEKDGAFYGTTERGGSHLFYGTVFKLTQTGSGYTEHVLYSFQSGLDGAHPLGGVIADAQGDLFGTTSEFGGDSEGTVFKLSRAGATYTESTLHYFDDIDGEDPDSGLISDSHGRLYGTTLGASGGQGQAGAAFVVKP